MKKGWLRGMLLGVSLALLLAGGVALAQGLYLTAEKDCVECYPGQVEPTQDRYLLPVTMGGWDHTLPLCQRVSIDGEWMSKYCGDPPPEDPYTDDAWFPCEVPVGVSMLGLGVDVSQPKDALGEWLIRTWQENPPGTVLETVYTKFTVAETCEEAVEAFVPEPGSILLLGSGLAGLAGYATLRWRSRQ